MADAVPIEKTEAAANNLKYLTAMVQRMCLDYGQRIGKGTREHGTKTIMPMQVKGVDKLLNAACEVVESSDIKVVLDISKNGKSEII